MRKFRVVSAFLKRAILKKNNIFQKHNFGEKIVFKKQILKKKLCTQKITLWFNLPRKMRKRYVLRGLLKSTILKKKFSLKSTILNIKFSSKKHNFEWKSFCKKNDFELKFFRLVRFRINFFTTRQILNQLF